MYKRQVLRAVLAGQARYAVIDEAQLSRLSFEDSLTGLFNRNRFTRDMNNYFGTERALSLIHI